jgi:flagellar FliL protein
MSAAAAAAHADAPADAKPKKSKKLLFIIIGVLVLALVGAGAAFFVLKKKHSADESEDGAHADETHETAAPPKRDPKTPPTFLPLDSMVVNLADPGGNRFVQLGITLQLEEAKIAEDMKPYMPAIRNAILMLISQRTAEQMLAVEGKEDLSQNIIAEVSHIMGFDYVDPREDVAEDESAKGKKTKRKREVYNPISGVLYSSFIVQ